MKLVILPEYQAVVTPMRGEEYEGLKLSIKERGQLLPIIVNQDNVILDGHNRYKICQELGIDPIVEVKKLTKKEEVKFVLFVNTNRRHLNPIAIVIIACKEHNSDWKIGDKCIFERNETETAMRFGLSKGTFHRAWQIVEKRPKMIEKILSGDESYGAVYNEIIRDLRNAARSEALQLAPPAIAKLFLDDFRKVVLRKGSIDAIITDPPYGKKFLDLYDSLAEKAVEWLRPEGSLMVMTGQYFLQDVLKRLSGKGLEYYWILAYRMPGGTAFERTKPMQNAWKPIIWLTNGPIKFSDEEIKVGTPRFPMGSDMVVSKKAEKSGSKKRELEQTSFDSSWQQSVSGFEQLVQKCTKPTDIILDPMMGVGTTGVAALRLKRKFIGIELDPIPFKDANGRIVEEEKKNAS